MYENPDENKQIHAKCLPLFNISPIYAWKITPISRFREAYVWKLPGFFFAKMGTSMVYILVGSGGPGMMVNKNTYWSTLSVLNCQRLCWWTRSLRLKIARFFHENGYAHGIYFSREWGAADYGQQKYLLKHIVSFELSTLVLVKDLSWSRYHYPADQSKWSMLEALSLQHSMGLPSLHVPSVMCGPHLIRHSQNTPSAIGLLPDK